jgi:hypothetical protein
MRIASCNAIQTYTRPPVSSMRHLGKNKLYQAGEVAQYRGEDTDDVAGGRGRDAVR